MEGDRSAPEPEIQAFTADQVCRLTGLSRAQLGHWDRTRFFVPRYVDTEGGRAYGRVYSFRDVVGLRTLAVLRNEHDVSLQQLRKVGAQLAQMEEAPWASLRFYLAGREVVFENPSTGKLEAARPGSQTVLELDLEPIARAVQDRVSELRRRSPKQLGHVTRHRHVVQNTPVMDGTRIPVAAIRSLSAAGLDVDAIVREYPRLAPEDVRAAAAQGARKSRRRGPG
jgi:uncharacterized protein (DUF433 family)